MSHVIVIGAGPYGLSIAANLRQRNIPFRIFGRTMAMWTDHMPRGMVLKSDGFATNFGDLPLTLERFCHLTGRAYGHLGHRTPLADVIAYGHAVHDQYVGAVEDKRVVALTPDTHGFHLQLDTGEEAHADRVVVATGLIGFQRLPQIAGAAPEQMTHVSTYTDLAQFAGRRVVIIGGGQSAFETAALLHEQGAAQVTVLSRRPPFWFDPEGESVPTFWRRLRHPNFGLGPGWRTWLWSETPRLFSHLPQSVRLANAHSTFGPAGSGWLRHRVIGVPNIDLRVGTATRLDGTDLTITDPNGSVSTLTADHVIAATGYKADMRKIGFLAPLLRIRAADLRWAATGLPMLNRRYETSIAGLHMVGYLSAVALGPSMRFIYGTNFAGPFLARNLGQGQSTTVQVNRPLTKQAA